MAKKAQIASQLGPRIRQLRRQKKITLIELSKMTRIAQATLSRMETGLMVGTIGSHQKIAETLGVSLSQLYDGFDSRPSKIGHLPASAARKVTTKTEQMRCELLTQEISKKKITPLLITLNQRGKSAQEQLDRGVEKFLMVLDGNVTVKVDRDEFALATNDTIYFDATLPHQVLNSGSRQAKIFCAVSPSKI
jgi:transcriptional regulator with XRE-family HTH domain